MPELEKLLENFPFAAVFWVAGVQYTVSCLVDLAPLVRHGDLKHSKILRLLLVRIGSMRDQDREVVRQFLKNADGWKHPALPFAPIFQCHFTAPACLFATST